LGFRNRNSFLVNATYTGLSSNNMYLYNNTDTTSKVKNMEIVEGSIIMGQQQTSFRVKRNGYGMPRTKIKFASAMRFSQKLKLNTKVLYKKEKVLDNIIGQASHNFVVCSKVGIWLKLSSVCR